MKSLFRFGLVVLGVFLLSGCASKSSTKVLKLQEDLKKEKVEASKKDDKIKQLEMLIDSYNVNLATPSKKVKKDIPSVISKNSLQDEGCLVPSDAKAGECFGKALIPAKYKVIKQKILKTPASKRTQTIPEKYVWTTKKILEKEESFELVTTPATYKFVDKEIMVEPKKEKVITTPAKYKIVNERVVVSEAYETWEQGRDEIKKVKVPAEYRVVKKRVLVSPESTKRIVIPAVYKSVKVKEVDQKASSTKVRIPATYRFVKIKKITSPAKTKVIDIPAGYETISKKVKVSDARLSWEPIICKDDVNTNLIKKIQLTLKSKGYRIGRVDGIFGNRTKRILNQYQKDNNLAAGALTIATLKSLNIK